VDFSRLDLDYHLKVEIRRLLDIDIRSPIFFFFFEFQLITNVSSGVDGDLDPAIGSTEINSSSTVMEAVGLSVGIAGLFSACMDLVERIDAYKDFGIESRSMISRFEADKIRFKRWGSNVGINNGKWKGTHDPQLDDSEFELVIKRILNSTLETLKAADFTRSQLRNNGDSPLAISGELAKTKTKSPPSKSIRGGFDWAFKRRYKFANQIDSFNKLVEALYNVIPPTNHESRLVRRPTRLEDNIGMISYLKFHCWLLIGLDAQTYGQLESTNVSKDVQLLLEQWRRKAILESKNAVNDWLDVIRFNDQYNMSQIYDKKLSLRLQGTCEWILRHPSYRLWISDDSLHGAAKFLWISASAGSGKTILCASLIGHLEQLKLAPVAYFFASQHAQSGGEPSAIIRSWIAQLAQCDPDILELLEEYHETGHKAVESTIWSVFRSIISQNRKLIFVLDGFDEYNRVGDVRAEFLQELKKATEGSDTRVLISSRNEKDIEAELSPFITKTLGHVLLECKVSKEDVRHDILRYSKSVVERSLPDKNDELKGNLATELAEKCDGMFLWIKLQRGLRSGKTAKELHRTVRNMPTGLTETYERNWKQVLARDPEDRERALAILRWVTFALRPLTVAELTEALVFELGDDSTRVSTNDLDEKIDNISDKYISTEIVDMCASLVEARTEQPRYGSGARTIHLIHASVREFLLSRYSVGLNEDESIFQQHNCIATTCLTYLNRNEVWLKENSRYKYAFVQYAGTYWDSHVKAANDNSRLFDLVGKFLRYENVSFAEWTEFQSSSTKRAGKSEGYQIIAAMPLYYAAFFDLTSIMKSIWDTNKGQLNAIGGQYGTPLQAACFKGHASAFNLLIQWGADPNVTGGKFGVAINAAVNGNQKNMVETLLGVGANLALKDPMTRTPLHTAAMDGYNEILNILIEAGGDLEARTRDGSTPLNIASNNGHLEVVQLLLEKGADITTATNNGWTPLNVASANGHFDVVKLLVERGAVITTANNDGWAPLIAASSNGHTKVVKLLVEKGADITAANNNGWTPLLTASGNGHLDVVKLLVERGADIAAANNDGWAPLIAASSNGHTEVVKLLVARGADIAAEYGQTPLAWTAKKDTRR